MVEIFCKRHSITKNCPRDSDNSITLRDFHKIFVSPEHCPDIGMVLVLSMVVQRGLHVVSARIGESRLGSCGKVCEVLPRCRSRP